MEMCYTGGMRICNYNECEETVKFKDTCYRHTEKLKRDRRRKEYQDILGGACCVCGGTERLEFDHIDPKTKMFSIGTGLGYSRERVLAELEKCQLLCRGCHIEKSAQELRISGKLFQQKTGKRERSLEAEDIISRMSFKDFSL